MTSAEFLREFGGVIDAPNGIKKLREMVLGLAVQGKLSQQDSDDEPADVLLQNIKLEQQTLIKDGVIKTGKDYPAIDDDEIPYVVPDSWRWIRINEIGHNWGQKVPDNNFTYIDVSAINKEAGIIQEPSILTAVEAPSRARKIVKKGTVIYSTVRPYLLNIAIVEDEFEPEPISSTAFAIIHPYSEISARYIYSYLRSPTFINYVESVQAGIAYPAINDKQFFNGLFPLPPLPEQHRIVAKVDELMTLCDQLEAERNAREATHQRLIRAVHHPLTEAVDAKATQTAWHRIRDNFAHLYNTLESVQALRQTILQLAVQGKLVEQDPNDEPAEELRDKIREVKSLLIKNGVIRKSKPVSCNKVGDSALPSGWIQTPLDDISVIGTGTTPSKSRADYYGGDIAWVTSSATSGEYIERADTLITEKAVTECRLKTYQPGTLIVALYGQGKTRGQVAELSIPATINQACASVGFVPGYASLRPFIKLSLKKQYAEMREMAAGGAQPNLNVQKIKERIIALPPLPEQHRIVAKVDQLMSLCDQLETNIREKNDTAARYAEAIVQQIAAA